MIAAGVLGTFCMLAVNAWMNAPAGFTHRRRRERVTDVDPLAAMFNGAVWQQFIHMFVACYLVTGFLTAAVYAIGMLRGRRDRHHRLGFTVPVRVRRRGGAVQPFIGHFAGMRLYSDQPSEVGRDGAGDQLRTRRPAPARRRPDRRRGALRDPDPAVGIVAVAQRLRPRRSRPR